MAHISITRDDGYYYHNKPLPGYICRSCMRKTTLSNSILVSTPSQTVRCCSDIVCILRMIQLVKEKV